MYAYAPFKGTMKLEFKDQEGMSGQDMIYDQRARAVKKTLDWLQISNKPQKCLMNNTVQAELGPGAHQPARSVRKHHNREPKALEQPRISNRASNPGA